MYNLLTVEDVIAVPASKMGMDLGTSIKQSLAEKYEGKIDSDIGISLAVVDVDEIGEGSILPGDPSIHYSVNFKLLTWMPREHELVEGEVVDITEWGSFIRVGPVDGLVHISQVMDDYVSYDDKNSQLAGKSSRRILKVGDKIKARIITISLKEQNKVGLTMRQPYLGSLKWIEAVEKEKKKEDTRGKGAATGKSAPTKGKPKKKGKDKKK